MTAEKSEKGGELEWRRKISNPMRKETRERKKKRKGEDEGWQIIVEEEERGEKGRKEEREKGLDRERKKERKEGRKRERERVKVRNGLDGGRTARSGLAGFLITGYLTR